MKPLIQVELISFSVLSENLNSDSFTPKSKDKNPDPPIDKKGMQVA